MDFDEIVPGVHHFLPLFELGLEVLGDLGVVDRFFFDGEKGHGGHVEHFFGYPAF